MPDPVISSSDAELRQHVERVLSAHYEVDREIGRGGMGIVFLARDKRLKRQVAIKLLPPELAFRSEIRSRFLREAETAASLSHPNIVPIFSVDEREGLVYFIMGYVDGGNLATRLQEHGPLDPEKTRRILRDVADALAYAHGRNVIHRDIKPDNILLNRDDDRPIVTDFGIARAISEGADSRLTATGMAIGTPAYMSPEQAAGEREIDGRSDLYSLGVLGYQMLTGEPPFTANSTPALLVKHLSEEPMPVSHRRAGIPDDLARAVMMLLAKDPAHRFPSAGALVTALDERRVPEPAANGARSVARPLLSQPAGGVAPRSPMQDGVLAPTAGELDRWNAAPVRAFRQKVAPYLFVNGVIVLMAILSSVDLVFITAFWSVYMAYQYAKLWTDGYDWRDVFKQPKDRMLFDVAAETVDDARALFDPQKREVVRARERERRQRLESGFGTGGMLDGMRPTSPNPGLGGPAFPGPAALPPGTVPAPDGTGSSYQKILQEARGNRDDIVRMMHSLPKRDREALGDAVGSADALLQRVQALAISLAETDASGAADAEARIEEEIRRLEAEANPLDERASEERVRRLALLKRQRRAVRETEERTARDSVRLENCVEALRTMKFDLLRLKQGNQSPQQVTLLVEQAMSLANDVDGIVMANDLARGTGGGRHEERGSRV